MSATVTEIKECPVCYENLTIENVVNLQCVHALCKTCFKNWVDDSDKNTCPVCRADILKSVTHKLRFEKNIIKLQYEIEVSNSRIDDIRKIYNTVQNKIFQCRGEKKYLLNENNDLNCIKKSLITKIEEYKHDIWRYGNECSVAKNKWLKNPRLATKYWEDIRKKVEDAQIRKNKYLFRRPIKELNKFIWERKTIKPSSIKNHNLGIKLHNKYLKHLQQLDVGIGDCNNMFNEDTSNYKEVEGLEIRLLCKEAILKNKCICPDCKKRNEVGCTFENDCNCSECYASMPGLESDTGSDTGSDDWWEGTTIVTGMRGRIADRIHQTLRQTPYSFSEPAFTL